jgi:hypothetical protein
MPLLLTIRSAAEALTAPEARARTELAEQGLEEAALVTVMVSGLAGCLHLIAWDIGLGRFVPFDGTQFVVWCGLAVGMYRHRLLPAYLLLLDLAVRAKLGILSGGWAFAPADLAVAFLAIRGLLRGLDLWQPPWERD